MKENKLKLKNKAAQEIRHWVRTTQVCNNKCLFCLDQENQNGRIISLEDIAADLKNGRRNGATRAIISGGDPTLHPQIFNIIKMARKIGYSRVQMISNGRMLAYEDFAANLKKAGLDEITLSLHSHKKDQFEKMTQVKGSYEQAMKGLINALKYKFIVSVDIVINKINYKTLKETLIFFIKLGISEFDLLYIIPFGSAWTNKKELFFSPKRAGKYLDAAFSLAKKKDIFLWTNRLPAIFLEGHEDLIQNPLKLKDEVRGMERALKSYVVKDQMMACFGERCRYCFMKDFCSDFMELKKTKTLESKSDPICLGKGIKKEKKAIFKFNDNLDIYKFLDFYIKHRYFMKSARCEKCRHNNGCDGAKIDQIRNKGFKILKPQT